MDKPKAMKNISGKCTSVYFDAAKIEFIVVVRLISGGFQRGSIG